MKRSILVLFSLLMLSGCSGFGAAIERGDAAMKRQDWDAAVHHYERATKIDPDDQGARKKLAQAQAEAVGWRLDGARESLAKGELLDAAQATVEADGILPGNGEVAALQAKVLEAVVATGRTRTDQKRFAEAHELHVTVGPLLPDPKGRVAEGDAYTVEQWLIVLKAAREAAIKAGRTGDAVLNGRQIIALAPTAVDRAQCTQFMTSLRGRYELAMGQRMLPPDEDRGPRGGREKSTPEERFDKLARAITGARPDQWLRITAPEDKAKTSVVLGFTQSSTRITDRHDRETRSEKVQTGTRRRPNPDYDRAFEAANEAERRSDRARRDMETAQTKVDQASAKVTAEGPSPDLETAAERDLADAQRALDAARATYDRARQEANDRKTALDGLPRELEEPVIETIVYDVMHHSVRAAGRLVTSVERGTKKFTPVEWPLLVEARDDAAPEVPPLHLAADPMQLPSDRELRDSIADQALQALEKVVQDTFAAALADQRAKAMALNGDARVEQLIVYMLMDKATKDAEADQLLFEVRGIPGASTLLDDCGTPAQ